MLLIKTLFIMLAVIFFPVTSSAGEKALNILYTGALQGELEPCGCSPETQSGGLARLVDQPVVVVVDAIAVGRIDGGRVVGQLDQAVDRLTEIVDAHRDAALDGEPVEPDRRDNLFAAVGGAFGSHGRFDARARARSWQWSMSTRRWRIATLVLLVLLGALGALGVFL